MIPDGRDAVHAPASLRTASGPSNPSSKSDASELGGEGGTEAAVSGSRPEPYEAASRDAKNCESLAASSVLLFPAAAAFLSLCIVNSRSPLTTFRANSERREETGRNNCRVVLRAPVALLIML